MTQSNEIEINEELAALKKLAISAAPRAEWYKVKDLSCHSNINLMEAKLISYASPARLLALANGYEQALSECLEQARLNGMGMERELRMHAVIDEQSRKIAELERKLASALYS